MSSKLYVGLMSGTSMDGIDAVLVDLSDNNIQLVASHSETYSDELKLQLENLVKNPTIHLDKLGALDTRIGKVFSNAVNQLLKDHNINAGDVIAIGSHGQTIRHHVESEYPFSMQIGNANVIAAETGITTVADFRGMDIALGGQGAPLVPAFHQALFADNTNDRAVVNIGGISNVTLLSSDNKVLGHDCGPGNTLMDQWALEHIGMPFDHSGAWANQGMLQESLLLQLLTDDYFKLAPPKSTGREYFNLNWLSNYTSNFDNIDPVDIQRTLCELTAQSIATDIINAAQEHLRNTFLMERLNDILPFDVISTDSLGYPSDWIEALAFAWFAKNTLEGKPSNVPSVTGAKRETILGSIFKV